MADADDDNNTREDPWLRRVVQEEGVDVLVVYPAPEVDNVVVVLVNAQTHIRLSTMAPKLIIIKSIEWDNRLTVMVEIPLSSSSCSA
jgi:hypothetical protein